MEAESVETIDNIEDIEDEEVVEKVSSTWLESWNKLPMIPNKKRFIVLSIVFSVLELAGLFIIAYAFLGVYPTGLFAFAIFMMAPFTGLALSYFIENKKEAVGISTINAVSSILIYCIIHILLQQFLFFPVNLEFHALTHIGIPLIFMLIQILIAFTMTRVRSLYGRYGDSSKVRKSDQAMIDELRANRIARGIEEPEEEAKIEELE
ncbi:MAG: hypothetical protein FK733_00455 [Asgard group archaeon]|nr:hypothetical protein [Asgard group archaeon]